MATSETRMSHPSPAQAEYLLEFLESRPDLAHGYGKTKAIRERGHRDWFRISMKLNNMPGGAVKSMKRWLKYWADKKNGVKKKMAAIEKSHDGLEEHVLSPIDQRVLGIIQRKYSGNEAEKKRNTVAQPEDENSQNDIVTTFLLDESIEAEEVNYDDMEDSFLTDHDNDSSQPTKKHEIKETPVVSSSRRGRLKLPPKLSSQSETLSAIVNKLSQIEQQRLELDRRMVDIMERNSDRDHMLAEAVKAMGEGLKALAEAISKN